MHPARIAGTIVGVGLALLLSGIVGVALAASSGALAPPQVRLRVADAYLLAYTTTTPTCVATAAPQACPSGRGPRGYARTSERYYVAWLLWYSPQTASQPRELLLSWQPLALPLPSE
jgi:hypothetical protein